MLWLTDDPIEFYYTHSIYNRMNELCLYKFMWYKFGNNKIFIKRYGKFNYAYSFQFVVK